jgi:hypothetical protein
MQLWLTFEELGEWLNCNSQAARNHVYENQWERRRCSEGITRALLPPNLARAFILGYAAKQCAPIDEPLQLQEDARSIETSPKLQPGRGSHEWASTVTEYPARHDVSMPWATLRPLSSPFAAPLVHV